MVCTSIGVLKILNISYGKRIEVWSGVLPPVTFVISGFLWNVLKANFGLYHVQAKVLYTTMSLSTFEI